jgi:hypothetical protein
MIKDKAPTKDLLVKALTEEDLQLSHRAGKYPDETQYIVRVSDKDYINKLTGSSEGVVSHGTNNEEEDDDDLLKEDVSNWDVFDDYHKFQLREQKLKEKRKKEALK